MPKLRFDPEEHKYFLGDIELISVTRVLALAGLSNQFNRDEEAALRGRYVHKATLLLDRDELDWETLDSVLAPYIMAYQDFRSKYPCKIIAAEKVVGSETYRFAGMLDRVIVVDGHYELFDIGSGGLDPVKALQTAAYQIAWEETTKGKIRKRFGLQLKNNGKFSIKPYTEKTDRGTFLGALATVQWRRRNRRGE